MLEAEPWAYETLLQFDAALRLLQRLMPYLKGMHDKVIHVVIMHHVVAELLGQHLLDADLLCADEALDHHTAQQAKVKCVYGTKVMCAQSSLLTGSV